MNKSVNFLIAEDTSSVGMILRQILKSHFSPCEVYMAKDGEEALALLERHDFAAVISDWNMPKVNGQQLLARIRKNERLTTIPFVMVTGRTDLPSVREAIRSGVSDYILKPFAPEVVVRKLNRLFADCGAGQAAADE